MITAEESAKVKSRVQEEALQAFNANNEFGLIVMATGAGKSKVAIDKCKELVYDTSTLPLNILLVVPTEKLRDEGWRDEFIKWGLGGTYELVIKRECYASLHSIKDEVFDLVILDECHNITEANSIFWRNNSIMKMMALTATYPDDKIKQQLLAQMNLKLVYELTLDDAVDLGLVAPYEITMVGLDLDSKNPNVKAGSKEKPFYQTEKAAYNYLTRCYLAAPGKIAALKRMRFIYNLKSKTNAALLLLTHVIPNDIRTLIFCGSKDQANWVCPHRFYSKPSKPKKLKVDKVYKQTEIKKYEEELKQYEALMEFYQGDESYNKFKQELINQLSCVEALNEGDNITGLDCGLVVQLNSTSLDLVQRIGRILRFREGHIGRIIILYVKDTVDEEWAIRATSKLNPERIKITTLEELRTGQHYITF